MTELPDQVHVAYKDDPLSEAAFKGIQARGGRSYGWVKPRGGFWTSTAPGREQPCTWLDWCADESFCKNDIQGYWKVTPAAGARIFKIDGYGDLADLCAEYPNEPHPTDDALSRLANEFPNWYEVAKDFDAVYLTDQGQWQTRMSSPHNLYGWDCESTLWLRWAIKSVEKLPMPEVNWKLTTWELEEA